ncbi:hypothetical protein [Nocardioides sp. CF8]|uniref:hypothetical protein n=1 Tax=Nocardioides sp. CF8 TaxID=110319 RepID=UPI0012EB94DC|nr:hypothetical protein [Nocardioides sp. CF8]
MSEHQPPPPGWSPPPVGPATQPYSSTPASWSPAPPLRAAHKPGAIPLRPLSLGDMYDAAFKIIRFNPRATVGSAILVAAVAMTIPLLATAALGAALDLSMADGTFTTSDDPASMSGEDIAGFMGVLGSLAVGGVLQGIGLILVGGMIAHVVAAAATGHKLSLGQAWAATRGKRWRLIGLTLLLGLATTLIITLYVLSWVVVAMTASGWQVPVVYGVLSVPVFLAFLFWFWVRVYYLPVPALMLEPIGVLDALGRGFRLTRGAFWRTFGIALLTFVVAQLAGTMLTAPISLLSQGVLLGGLPGEAGVFLFVLGQAVASVVTAAFVAPFTTSVATLQYVDLRMRAEAFDVVLMQRSGITRS